ncbi:hypothetical protein [Lactococcus petauri]|uniref:hypothetical protein n=1 Tax=Lactococcus petauri TaxID=1940789 RepID=UPI001F59B7EB|nr:hypothetical protein [Lactococcus petauri]
MSKVFIAYRKGKPITAYQAIKLRNYKEISTTYAKAEIFDSPDPRIGLPVFPKENSNGAYFSHYSETPRYLRERNERLLAERDVTFTHKLYEQVFSQLEKFMIEAYNVETSEVETIELFINNAVVEAPIRDPETGTYYFVDVLLELKATKPYYYFYKWNGRLALEIKVTHEVNQEKRDSLNRLGYQIFEIGFEQATIDKLEKEAKYFNTEALFNQLVEKKKLPFQEEKYFRSGRMLGQAQFIADFREKYAMIFGYEKQVADLVAQKRILKQEVERQKLDMIEQQNRFNAIIADKKAQMARTEEQGLQRLSEVQREKESIEKSYCTKKTELEKLKIISKECENLERQVKQWKGRYDIKAKEVQEIKSRTFLQTITSFFQKGKK